MKRTMDQSSMRENNQSKIIKVKSVCDERVEIALGDNVTLGNKENRMNVSSDMIDLFDEFSESEVITSMITRIHDPNWIPDIGLGNKLAYIYSLIEIDFRIQLSINKWINTIIEFVSDKRNAKYEIYNRFALKLIYNKDIADAELMSIILNISFKSKYIKKEILWWNGKIENTVAYYFLVFCLACDKNTITQEVLNEILIFLKLNGKTLEVSTRDVVWTSILNPDKILDSKLRYIKNYNKYMVLVENAIQAIQGAIEQEEHIIVSDRLTLLKSSFK
jgi:hypothetical protein